MDRSERGNGAEDKNARQFYVGDASGNKRLIRKMSATELTSNRVGVAHLGQQQLKDMMTRIQLLLPPFDASMLVSMIEKVLVNASTLMVLEFEQNRRENFPDPEMVERISARVMELIESKYETLAVTGIGLRAVIEHALKVVP